MKENKEICNILHEYNIMIINESYYNFYDLNSLCETSDSLYWTIELPDEFIDSPYVSYISYIEDLK